MSNQMSAHPRCFVAGSPIAHSRSPLIHGHWLDALGLAGSYERIEVRPADLPALLARVRAGELAGGNLTVPLKEAAVPLLDDISPAAAAMGAVNTVFMRDGRLCGENTDVPGFFASLDAEVPGWDRKARHVLILGAGGAARAIAYGFLKRNVTLVSLANRTPERAVAIRDALADPRLRVQAWPVEASVVAAHDVIVNATSLGMKGQPPLDLHWPDDMAGKLVSDAVYVPLETTLLASARARGATCVDGLGMLLHQAALAFGHWFGTTPGVTPTLRRLIEADLGVVR
jgi:shikimate dehydrogenase